MDPFNVFQNTPDYSLKDLGCSRPGDYVEFEVLGRDCVVGVSSCPYDVVCLLLFLYLCPLFLFVKLGGRERGRASCWSPRIRGKELWGVRVGAGCMMSD